VTDPTFEPIRLHARKSPGHPAAPWWAIIAVFCVVVLGLIAFFEGNRTTAAPASPAAQSTR
jgi:hypothetical protein